MKFDRADAPLVLDAPLALLEPVGEFFMEARLPPPQAMVEISAVRITER
jgi:hypothetical protein